MQSLVCHQRVGRRRRHPLGAMIAAGEMMLRDEAALAGLVADGGQCEARIEFDH